MNLINDQFRDSIPLPKDSSAKEVYTYFGLASYWGQLLEKGYLQLSVSLGILDKESPTQEYYDKLWAKFEKFTLGKLLKSASNIIVLPDDLERLSLESLDKRNYLIHHFFWDHTEDMISNIGRKLMIDELINLTMLFKQTDNLVNNLVLDLLKKQGVKEQDIVEIVDDMVSNALKRDLE